MGAGADYRVAPPDFNGILPVLIDRAHGGTAIVFARRRAGVSLVARQYTQDDAWWTVQARQLSTEPIGANSTPSDPLNMAAVLSFPLAGLLLLAWAAGRNRELAVRAALGAGRWRLLALLGTAAWLASYGPAARAAEPGAALKE